MDDEKLNSARKRLQENYQEAKNGLLSIFGICFYNLFLIWKLITIYVGVYFIYEAKKQRTIQVMDIHDIPKPKNGFIARNKGSFAGRHNRWFCLKLIFHRFHCTTLFLYKERSWCDTIYHISITFVDCALKFCTTNDASNLIVYLEVIILAAYGINFNTNLWKNLWMIKI